MTETDKIKKLEEDNQRLFADNVSLTKKNKDLQTDLDTAIDIIKKIMQTLGLLPMPENPLKAIIKAISKLSTNLLFSSDSVAKEFDFIKDIVPLAQKHIKEYQKDGL